MSKINMPHTDTVSIRQSMQERRAEAQAVRKVLMAESSRVRRLAVANRGNNSDPYNRANVDAVFAATIDEEIERTRGSVRRFGS